MDIEKRLIKIINTIEDQGYQALIVGGAVRNSLLNLEVIDYDLATNASLNEVSKLFSNTSFIYRNKVQWALKVNFEGFIAEISTFRIEKDYDNRIPKQIILVDNFKDDVLRRDFTINAIGYSLSDGFLDYTNGINDLKNKLIKVIGNPTIRFKEDPIRILRALRLASTLNFNIETKTLTAVKELYPIALKATSTQIAIELSQIIAGNNFDYVYKQVPTLFADISASAFKNIKLKDRKVLKDKETLFIYLKYIIGLDSENKMFKILNINESIVVKISKLSELIISLLKDVTSEEMTFALIDYGKDKVKSIINILSSLNKLPPSNFELFEKINLEGYIKIDELNIGINDIDLDVEIKTKYALLETLQKQVIANKVKNDKQSLLKRLQEIIK